LTSFRRFSGKRLRLGGHPLRLAAEYPRLFSVRLEGKELKELSFRPLLEAIAYARIGPTHREDNRLSKGRVP
jgi:hypothetical protein